MKLCTVCRLSCFARRVTFDVASEGTGPSILSKEAYFRIADKVPPERAPNQSDAIIAIVFSAAALEAFINEAADLASRPPVPGTQHPNSVSSFASVMREVERSHGSVQLKFLLTRWIFAGEPYNQGALPYQDFKLLIDLRNELLHMNLETYALVEGQRVDAPPAIVEKLRSKNILAEVDYVTTWLSSLMTLATARWACNAAAHMVESMLQLLPDGDFKELMTSSYSWPFQVTR